MHVRQGQSDPCRQRISTRVHVWPTAATTAELSANQLGSAATTGASSTATAELGTDEPDATTTAPGTSSAATATLITGGGFAPFAYSREGTSRRKLRLATTSNRKAPRQAVRPAEGLERVHVCNVRGVSHDQKIPSACARKYC
jgi:hypothetical protein